MSFDTWMLYLATVLVLMSTPGPSHLLMLSTSVTNGFRRATATAAGDLSANALQMLAAGLGLASMLAASQTAFSIVKLMGAAYLIWLGVKSILRSFSPDAASDESSLDTFRQLWWRGFVTSAANPKAVVFFAALFPQFLDRSAPLVLQLLILGGTYLVIDAAFLCGYGAGADWLARRLRGSVRRWIDRFAGASLVGAGLLLGLKSARQT